MATTPAPDLPDFTAAHQPVTVPTLLASVVVPPSGTSALIDVSAFSSYAVLQDILTPTTIQVKQIVDIEGFGPFGIGVTATSLFHLFDNVRGTHLQVINSDAVNSAEVQIIGYGTVLQSPHPITSGWVADPSNWNIPSQVWAVSGQVTFTSSNNIPIPQGPNYLYCRVSVAALTGFLSVTQGGGSVATLTDTGEFHNAPQGGMAVGKLVAVPADAVSLQWTAEAVATGAVFANFTPNY